MIIFDDPEPRIQPEWREREQAISFIVNAKIGGEMQVSTVLFRFCFVLPNSNTLKDYGVKTSNLKYEKRCSSRNLEGKG